MIPCLMITYNRLEYTKRALKALIDSDFDRIFVIDNGSTDGTRLWLEDLMYAKPLKVSFAFNKTANHSISYAMNYFLSLVDDCVYAGKVDNDTIVPPDFVKRMLPHMHNADIVQAKHPILKETHPEGFDAWVKNKTSRGALRYNHFVGGSGILFRREYVDEIPETDWVIGGWREFQRRHPELRKAFATDVEIELLDTKESGPDYSKFPDYYKQTGRLCSPQISK